MAKVRIDPGNLVAKHKIRFDRGRVYFGYVTALVTGIIVHILDTVHTWWIYPLMAAVTAGVVYFIGYLDQYFKVLSSEQGRYSNNNPFNTRLLNDLDEIKKELKGIKRTTGDGK